MTVIRDGAVARITLNKADRLNSLTTADLRELAHAITAADDGATKAIVLTGTGRAFCSGADLSGVVDGTTVTAAQDVVSAITAVRPVIIAAINGPAAGVGASIALACDLTVAVESAFLLMPFLPLGLVPDGGATYTLVARSGSARATRLAFGGERLSATKAAEWGLVGEVVPDAALPDRVEQLVGRVLDAPADAIFATKELLRRVDREGLDRVGDFELTSQQRLLASPEFARARAGFLSKTPVSFRDA